MQYIIIKLPGKFNLINPIVNVNVLPMNKMSVALVCENYSIIIKLKVIYFEFIQTSRSILL